jgi:hypothetical protein
MKELYISFIFMSIKVITLKKNIKTLTSERHYYYYYYFYFYAKVVI